MSFAAVFQDLLGSTVMDGTHSLESMNEEEIGSSAAPYQSVSMSPKPRRTLPSPPQAKKHSPRTPSPTRKLPPIPTERQAKDDIDDGRKV